MSKLLISFQVLVRTHEYVCIDVYYYKRAKFTFELKPKSIGHRAQFSLCVASIRQAKSMNFSLTATFLQWVYTAEFREHYV